ncbi:MAG: hypothetical protein A2054_05315 [Deltaproteobacteria bacterium GWA2_55_10]|nr:MAG: hypothetical protein A2054_05315 [Deltaproteobacteria bacterium GWA2_55_10]
MAQGGIIPKKGRGGLWPPLAAGQRGKWILKKDSLQVCFAGLWPGDGLFFLVVRFYYIKLEIKGLLERLNKRLKLYPTNLNHIHRGVI